MRSFLPLVELITPGAAVDLARVDTDVGEAAKEWVGDNLERERGEGSLGQGYELDDLPHHEVPLNRRNIEWFGR